MSILYQYQGLAEPISQDPETPTLDKWYRELSRPVRRRPTPVNTTHNFLVEFSVPAPEDVTLDKWVQPQSIPKWDVDPPRSQQYQLQVFPLVLGFPDFSYNGTVGITLIPGSAYSAIFGYTGSLSLSLTPGSDYDGKFNYTGTASITLKAPDTGTVIFTGSIPYFVMAAVRIDGKDYSSVTEGIANVTRQDNAAATFSIIIKDTNKKPAEFINRIIDLSFQAADENGVVADYLPLFKGIIKRVSFNESIRGALNLSGYDYGGVHGTPGELISDDITEVLTGSKYITGTGTYSTGFAPIWGVKYTGTADIVDGRDYFVNTLTGEIVVPLSSNFNSSPGGLTFSYAVPFESMKELIGNIVGRKNWSLLEDGVTIEDYTAIAKQPVLSMSDESVIDITRKFLELSGAKAETNLFPNMRIYSETENITGADNHVIDESIYYEDSLDIGIDIDDIITEQTVRSVAKTFANIQIGSSEELADKSGTVYIEVLMDVITWGTVTWAMVPKTLAEVRIRKANINSVSFVAGGTFFVSGPAINIQDSDWTQTIEDNDIVFRLKVMPKILFLFFRVIVYYPGADWTLTVNGTKINYGEGTIEQTVEVTASRPVTGITSGLKGDVHEHPWAETAGHCGKCANAILTERGNIYNASCEMPLHKAPAMQLGDKINIKRSGSVVFKGIIKTLSYNINTETAEAPVGIEAKGVGVGI